MLGHLLFFFLFFFHDLFEFGHHLFEALLFLARWLLTEIADDAHGLLHHAEHVLVHLLTVMHHLPHLAAAVARRLVRGRRMTHRKAGPPPPCINESSLHERGSQCLKLRDGATRNNENQSTVTPRGASTSTSLQVTSLTCACGNPCHNQAHSASTAAV